MFKKARETIIRADTILDKMSTSPRQWDGRALA